MPKNVVVIFPDEKAVDSISSEWLEEKESIRMTSEM